MISGEGHIPDAVRALKCGAADFIEKPIHPEHIMAKIMAKEGQLDLEESINPETEYLCASPANS